MDLINTLEAPGEFDALTTLRPGEPYFLLVGRDRLAPGLVIRWASYSRRRTLRKFDAGLITVGDRTRELRKCTQAEEIAWAMQAYKAGHAQQPGRTAPEVEKPTTYRGSDLPEDTKRSDALHSARVRAAAALNNACAELDAAVALLVESDDPDHRALAQQSGQLLNHISMVADAIEPRRPIGGTHHAR